MNEQIAILILFYNKLDQTKNCINSFLPSGHKIYVLNNGSNETQWINLQSSYSNHTSVVFFDAGKNLGVSAGRNFLINATKEEWLLSVDNDVTIRPQQNWNELFKVFIQQQLEAKIICPHIYNVHEQAYVDQLNVLKNEKQISIETGSFSTTNCFPGGASIIHRSIFETYGLFDEEMFVGFEDYEFALRAMLSTQGEFKACHIKEIELIHDHQFQKSSKDKEAVRQRYNEEKLKASYDRLVAKYNIVFDHNWQWWTRKQVQEMTENKWLLTMKKRIKKLLNS